MSQWIYITNLPQYYDEFTVKEIFNGIGQMLTAKISKDDYLLKSSAIIQFSHGKHAKLAASKKDQSVIGKSAIRVYLIWTHQETLSTVKVTNIPRDSSKSDLETYFNPFGNIVNIEIVNEAPNDDHDANHDAKKNEEEEKEVTALVSFSRIDYALQAAQEMNGIIIGIGHTLRVELLNPDARNLQWKRHSFEYISMSMFDAAEQIRFCALSQFQASLSVNVSPLCRMINPKQYRSYSASSHRAPSLSPHSTHHLPLSCLNFAELIINGYIKQYVASKRANIPCKVTTITFRYYFNDNLFTPKAMSSNSSLLACYSPKSPPPPSNAATKSPQYAASKSLSEESIVQILNTPSTLTMATEDMQDEVETEEDEVARQISDQQEMHRQRLNRMEGQMMQFRAQLDRLVNATNSSLMTAEQRRMNDMNVIQKQFNATIAALCYQVSAQIQRQIDAATSSFQQNTADGADRIDQLEKKLSFLQKENDSLRKQHKINKILSFQSGDEDEIQSPLASEQEKIQIWLQQTVKLPQYFQTLIKNGYDDFESVVDLTYNELEAIGIEKCGHRKKIMKYVTYIKTQRIEESDIDHIDQTVQSKQVEERTTNDIDERSEIGLIHHLNINQQQSMTPHSHSNGGNQLLYTNSNIWSDESLPTMPWTYQTPNSYDTHYHHQVAGHNPHGPHIMPSSSQPPPPPHPHSHHYHISQC